MASPVFFCPLKLCIVGILVRSCGCCIFIYQYCVEHSGLEDICTQLFSEPQDYCRRSIVNIFSGCSEVLPPPCCHPVGESKALLGALRCKNHSLSTQALILRMLVGEAV